MACVGGDIKDHLMPIPCCGQGFHPLDQAAQDSIQPRTSPGMGHSQLLWQPMPVPHHLLMIINIAAVNAYIHGDISSF